MCFQTPRVSPIVEGVLPDLPFVCSNVRFANIAALAHIDARGLAPLPRTTHTAGGLGARAAAGGRMGMGGRAGMN